jgi:hypothetical protein
MCAALNPMGAFGMPGAAAAAAMFGQNVTNNQLVGVRNNNNLLLNLNAASFSHNNTLNPISATSSTSSCDYHTDRTEWLNRIENAHIDRTLMNRLVMNYLVTGK